LVVLALAACQPAPQAPTFQATDITGAAFARDFKLTDHHGQVRELADFRGKVVAVFFGYVHCPDVCPTTLSDFARALEQLGAGAEQVQVIFVTVDPERDTPEVLKTFVPPSIPAFSACMPKRPRCANWRRNSKWSIKRHR
jgi:protein SCO1